VSAESYEAWVALGANLGDRAATLASAVRDIDALPSTRVLARSPWYENPAVGGPIQPDFLNGVLRLQTALAPLPLLDALLAIEAHHGRVRSIANAPRTLDLDLLWHTAGPLRHPRLTLPHPRIGERAFVLLPWRTLAPDFELPGVGPVDACWRALGAPMLPIDPSSDPLAGAADV
jgi:2-amino-4-hydroxy-6-hydroxymethyldihydropteridine diphosphokinase